MKTPMPSMNPKSFKKSKSKEKQATHHIICLSIIIFAVSLTGCGKIEEAIATKNTNTKLQVVQNGTLNFDSTVTVNNALSGYKYFKNHSWEECTDSQGRDIIQFKGIMDLDAYVGATCKGYPLSKDNIDEAKKRLKCAEYVIQFALSKSDNTFSIHGASFYFELIDLQTGQPTKQDIADEDLEILQAIYRNTPDEATSAIIVSVLM